MSLTTGQGAAGGERPTRGGSAYTVSAATIRHWQDDELPEWFKKKRGSARSLIVSRWVPLVMVGLPIAVLLFIVAYPTVQMAYYAFHDINMVSLFKGDYELVGFTNFERVLTSDRFHGSVINLIQYLFFGAVLQVIIGTALALILHHCVRNNAARLVILVILVMPMMLPPSIVGVLWRFLFNPSNGAINQALLDIGLIKAHIEWFQIGISLWTITIADIWEWTSLPFLIVFSGRLGLPPSIYEAARVDGASPSLTLRRITLPMLKEVIAIAFIIRFMDAYKFVDKVYVMTSGGPAQSSELPAYIAYQRGVREFEIGEAAAYAWIIFLFAIILITLFLRYLKRVLRAQAIA